MCFGGDGSTIASVGIDDNNSIYVHDWRMGKVVGEGAAPFRVLDICPNFTAGFNPIRDFITVGEEQVTFWTSASTVATGGGAAVAAVASSPVTRSKSISPAAAAIATAAAAAAAQTRGADDSGKAAAAEEAVTTAASDLQLIDMAGRLGNIGVKQTFLCVQTTRTHTLVGSADSHLYCFRDDRLVFTIPCHQGPFHSIQIVPLDG